MGFRFQPDFLAGHKGHDSNKKTQERKRVERKPRRAMHFENYLRSLPSVQFQPRSLDFSGGTAHTAGNAQKPTIPRRPHGPDCHKGRIQSSPRDSTGNRLC